MKSVPRQVYSLQFQLNKTGLWRSYKGGLIVYVNSKIILNLSELVHYIDTIEYM